MRTATSAGFSSRICGQRQSHHLHPSGLVWRAVPNVRLAVRRSPQPAMVPASDTTAWPLAWPQARSPAASALAVESPNTTIRAGGSGAVVVVAAGAVVAAAVE